MAQRTALGSSELTEQFHKPLTVAALERFDPELRLVFNRKHGCFIVLRKRGDGWTWVTDWTEGLLGSDNPASLIAYLKNGDTGPDGTDYEHIIRRGDEAAERHREKVERDADEDFRHATAENRRQLLRVYRPFYDYTGFTK